MSHTTETISENSGFCSPSLLLEVPKKVDPFIYYKQEEDFTKTGRKEVNPSFDPTELRRIKLV